MPSGLLPNAAADTTLLPVRPQEVTEAFLAALAADDLDGAAALLADDVRWVNVGLPTLRGRERVAKALAPLARMSGTRFEVYLHGIAADGGSVLTERTDVLVFGPLRLQFWVWGRFEVQDGQIVLWRDSFDYVDMGRAVVRGLVGAVLPPLRPRAPSAMGSQPGRH